MFDVSYVFFFEQKTAYYLRISDWSSVVCSSDLLSFIVLLLTRNVAGAVLVASLYCIASGVTAVSRATLPLQIFPAAAYGRATARLAVPLNLCFAAAPPVFTAIMTSAGPQASLWLAFAISIFAFCALLGLLLLHRR